MENINVALRSRPIFNDERLRGEEDMWIIKKQRQIKANPNVLLNKELIGKSKHKVK